MFTKGFKTSLIGLMLLCSISAALFGSACGAAHAGDGPAFRAQTCAMTFLKAPSTALESSNHPAVMVVQAIAVVSTIISLLVLVVVSPRFLGLEVFLLRRQKWRWVWAKVFGNYFKYSISIPYLGVLRSA